MWEVKKAILLPVSVFLLLFILSKIPFDARVVYKEHVDINTNPVTIKCRIKGISSIIIYIENFDKNHFLYDDTIIWTCNIKNSATNCEIIWHKKTSASECTSSGNNQIAAISDILFFNKDIDDDIEINIMAEINEKIITDVNYEISILFYSTALTNPRYVHIIENNSNL